LEDGEDPMQTVKDMLSKIGIGDNLPPSGKLH